MWSCGTGCSCGTVRAGSTVGSGGTLWSGGAVRSGRAVSSGGAGRALRSWNRGPSGGGEGARGRDDHPMFGPLALEAEVDDAGDAVLLEEAEPNAGARLRRRRSYRRVGRSASDRRHGNDRQSRTRDSEASGALNVGGGSHVRSLPMS